MRRSHYDLIFVLALIALAAWLYHAWPSAPGLVVGGEDFTLEEVGGGSQRLAEVQGPVLITLSAVGCPDCQARVEKVDRKSYQVAQQAGVKVWNLLVYADQTQGSNWTTVYSPSADMVLVDPGGKVSVNQLGGSDATCYILLDAEHKKVWQGQADPVELEQRLAGLNRTSDVSTSSTRTGAGTTGAAEFPAPEESLPR